MKKITGLIIFLLAFTTVFTFSFDSVKAKEAGTSKVQSNVIKIKLINSYVDTNTSEIVIRIKNKNSKTIQLKGIMLTDSENKRYKLPSNKIKIQKGKTEYTSIPLKKEAGQYKLSFIFNKKKVVKTIPLNVEKVVPWENDKNTASNINNNNGSNKNNSGIGGNDNNSGDINNDGNGDQNNNGGIDNNGNNDKNNDGNNNKYIPANITNKDITNTKSKQHLGQILLNRDFRIDKKGKSNIVIFSENSYKDTYKSKIKVIIKRKNKKGFKVCKKYVETKKSNIAFLNKTFKLNKKGKYKMVVKITRYKKTVKGTVKESSTYASNTVKFK